MKLPAKNAEFALGEIYIKNMIDGFEYPAATSVPAAVQTVGMPAPNNGE